MSVVKLAFIFAVSLACGLWISPMRAGCAMALEQPIRGPFPGVNIHGQVWLCQKLTEITLAEEKEGKAAKKLPLFAYWTSRLTAEDAEGPLGAGWYFPILEASCRPAGTDRLRVTKPDGYTITLKVTRRLRGESEVFPRQVSGSGWKGTQRHDKSVEIASDCGDRLLYDGKGRLREVTSDGASFSLVDDSSGKVKEIRQGAKRILTFNFINQHIVSLEQPAGQRAIFQFGDIFLSDLKNKLVGTKGLREISFTDGTSLKFEFLKQDTEGKSIAVNFPNMNEIEWDVGTRLLRKSGDDVFRIIPHPNNLGGAEFLVLQPNGKKSVYFNNKETGVFLKSTDDGQIEKIVRGVSGPSKGQIRTISVIEDGKERLIKRYDYDQNGRPIRFSSNGIETYNKRDDRGLVAEIKSNKEEISVVYDEAKRPVVFVHRNGEGKELQCSIRLYANNILAREKIDFFLKYLNIEDKKKPNIEYVNVYKSSRNEKRSETFWVVAFLGDGFSPEIEIIKKDFEDLRESFGK